MRGDECSSWLTVAHDQEYAVSVPSHLFPFTTLTKNHKQGLQIHRKLEKKNIYDV